MWTALLKSSFKALQRWYNKHPNCTTRWMTICKDNTKATEGSFFQIWIGEPWKLFKPMNIKKAFLLSFRHGWKVIIRIRFPWIFQQFVSQITWNIWYFWSCILSIDDHGVSRVSRSELTVKYFTTFDPFDKTRSTAEASILSTSVFKTSDSVTASLKFHLLFKASMTCDYKTVFIINK